VVFLFAATIFLSALLLFWIQLVMAKMLLPASGADRIDSPRSGRKHKAWGASPRIAGKKSDQARESGRQRFMLRLTPASRARSRFLLAILGLAPQALCSRPLRGLRLFGVIFRICKVFS